MHNIKPYFIGHNDKSFLTFCYDKTKCVENQKVVIKKECIGVISGRPLYCIVDNRKIMAYYVDHLCVHPDFRKTGVAPRLIQTHEYAQRHRNKKIAISTGKVSGKISLNPKGKNGFGYDPIFIPNKRRKTFGEMKPSQKFKLDHRYKAFKKIRRFF